MTPTENHAPSTPAVPAIPAGTLGIDTTNIDGRPYAMLYCIPCGNYACNVSSRGISSRIGGTFRTADLGVLLAAAAGHECPPAVRNA